MSDEEILRRCNYALEHDCPYVSFIVQLKKVAMTMADSVIVIDKEWGIMPMIAQKVIDSIQTKREMATNEPSSESPPPPPTVETKTQTEPD